MPRITRIRSDGFKGEFDEELAPGTVLSGPNGAGKSARLEALVYALSGRVPTGKSLDEVALYFGERGGTVQVEDAAGNWIQRGIKRDREKAKVSEISSGGGPEGGPLRGFMADPAVLDLRDFLSLSANKRREFVLQLCGQGEASGEDILEAVEDQYAKGVSGSAATAETLARPEDLPEYEAELAVAWTEPRGLREQLASHLLGSKDKTASEFCQTLAEFAGTSKNAARRSGVEARAAVRELEAQAQGAKAAAADIGRRQAAVATFEEGYNQAREDYGRDQEIRAEAEKLEREYGTLEQALASAKEKAAALTDPGPEPELPPHMPAGERPEEFGRRSDALLKQQEDLTGAFSHYHETKASLHKAQEQLVSAKEALEEHRRLGLGELVDVAQGIPEDAHELVPRLRRIVDAVSSNWRARKLELATRFVEMEDHLVELSEVMDLAEPRFKQAETRAKELDAELAALGEEERAWKDDADRLAAEYRAAVERREIWRGKRKSYDRAQADVDGVQESLKRTADVRREALGRLEASTEGAGYAVAERAAKLKEAKATLTRALEAAGAVKAFEEATARAKREIVAEMAWTRAERSTQRAREVYVGQATKPLVEDLQELLDRCGCHENRVYLDLENDRGKPIFDLGWYRQGDLRDQLLCPEKKTSISALSGGEAVLFCAALSVAIARRSKGRRILLIEADPLDETNLALLLDGLSGVTGELDACLVATSTPVSSREGWAVHDFNWEDVAAS